MDQDDIIRMAMKVGLYSGKPRTPGTGNMIVRKLERFATLVAEHEREACARLVEQYTGAWDDQGYALAQAIRQREKE